ncbi:hypothetical protein ACFOD9_12155 [Novosphingobium bradum]|uniref:Uncharacterized protein n=1 Tax=Novosphingobium bradum TaxID=1737444 RepID=A0ABV7IVK2_9SPHN
MTILYKVAPKSFTGDWLALTAPAYGSVSPQPGEKVFLWWSETQKGTGLGGYGYCVSAHRVRRDWTSTIEPVVTDFSGFGKADLAPFRHTDGPGPESTFAAKLYRHSLNKVVTLTREEEEFLDAVLNA